MFPVRFDYFSCHISGNFNRLSHGSPLRHETRKVIGGSKVLAVFYSPDLEMQLIFLYHRHAPLRNYDIYQLYYYNHSYY